MNKKFIFNTIIVIVIIAIIILLYSILKENNQIILDGEDIITIYQNETFIEPGYTGYDKNGNDITNQVIIDTNLNNKVLGDYTITYSLGKAKATRKVSVVHDDTTDITIKCSLNKLVLWKNSVFDIPKINVYDVIDGDISNKAYSTNNIDINIEGEYSINYSVTNSRNALKTFTLKVEVINFDYTYDEQYMNGNYVGIFKIEDENYNYTIMPDSSKIIGDAFTYAYDINGEYNFKIYDNNENYIIVNKNVTGVDKNKPVVSCIVSLYDNYSSVTVNATDENKIANYEYQYGNKKINSQNNTYQYNELINDVIVNATDIAGNIGTSKCDIKDLSTTFDRIYRSEVASNGMKYMLYIPKGYSYRKDMPFVVYLHGKNEADPTNINKVNRNGFPYYINKGTDYNFVMIAPQNKDETSHCEERMTVIKEVLEKYHLNENRIIISGFSYGAKYSYELVYRYPNFFAGCIGVGFYPTLIDYKSDWTDIASKTPTLGFHGTNDEHYERHRNAIKKLENINNNTKFYEEKGKDHLGSWPPVFAPDGEYINDVLTFIEKVRLK